MKTFLMLTALFISGAGITAHAEEKLDFSLKSDQVKLVNSSASSCLGIGIGRPDANVPAISGEIEQIVVSWPDQRQLKLRYIQITLDGVSDYADALMQRDLTYTWNPDPKSDQSLNIVNNSNNKNLCPIKFGSVPVGNTHMSFGGTGHISVFATYDGGAEGPMPMSGTRDFTYSYQGD